MRLKWTRFNGYNRKRAWWLVVEYDCPALCWGDGRTRDKALSELLSFHRWAALDGAFIEENK